MFTMDGHPRGPDGTRSPQFANSYHAYIKVNSLKYTIMQRASAKQLRYAKSIFKTGKLMKRIKNGLWAQLLLYAAAELRHEDLNRNQLSADELYAADVRFYEAGQREQIAIDHFDATAALLRQTMLTLMIEAREVLRKQMDQLQVLRELWLPLFGGDERGILELSMDPEVFRPNHDEANEAILSVQDHGEPQ